jgi:predicted ATPase/signal transduction histidine kinase/tRNA A-37 threonylcarbamoyl transferase component Bud32
MIAIPGYELVTVLREGRSTVILRARRGLDHRSVIIKTFRREHPSLRDVARLRHEHAVLSRFDDDGILRPLDFVVSGSRAALVLEDFDGASLREYIPPEGLTVAAFLALAPRIVRALAVVHAAGVLHKDIKPDNIIADPDLRRVALADFSIASVLTEERSAASSPEVLEGSLAYLSPEQTGRMNRPVDYRTDYYSLGATFYELLTGVLPFRSADPLELVHAHVARLPVAPDVQNPSIPAPLSQLVMRLLEKNAEARYQSSAGLLADLERMRAQWREHGAIESFPLGQDDRSEHFILPAALYGREQAAAELLAAFERACVGGNELLLLSGPAGIGKSALIREIHRPMVRHRGYFISGKFDQFGRDTPYSALAQALRELVLRILGEPEGRLVGWRKALHEALGSNARVVLDVVPDLERLLGPQPAIPDLPPTESANRFHATLRALIRAFADERHPVAIFLDDLQWSDFATLKLIEALVGDPELPHLLWIGAYRDDEVTPDHPLERTIAALKAAGAAVSRRTLPPLGPAEVGRMIADTLRCSEAEAAGLAELVHGRSEGNPFFVRTYLQSLHEQGVLQFDRSRAAWTWDLARALQATIPDDVVDLVARRIATLPANTQSLVRTAACIGGRFDLHLLARIAGQAPDDTLAGLWGAVEAGLVHPLGDDYKYLDEATPFAYLALFEFAHDRIQQSAHGLIPAADRPRLHLEIGRLLLAETDAARADAALFAVASHFSHAAALLSDPAERLRIAALDLRAARRAKVSTAYDSACSYLAAGLALLPAQPWTREYDLTAALHRERIECEYLGGHPERAVPFFAPVLTHVRSTVEKADLFALRATLETNRGDLAAAIAAGRAGLELFGVRLPKKASTASVLAEFARYQLLCRGAGSAQLSALPPMKDPERRAELRVMMAMTAAAYFTDNSLASVLLLRIASRSLQHGLSEVSAYGFMGVGLVLSGAFGKYESADELGRMACELNERFANAELRAKIALFWATFMMCWTRPFPAVKLALREAHEVGLAGGDLIYAVYSAVTEVFFMVLAGDPLEELCARCEALLPLLRRRGLADQVATVQYMVHVFGRVLRAPDLDDAMPVEDAALRAGLGDERTPLTMFYYHLYRAMQLYMFADYAGAHAALEQALTRTKAAFGSGIMADLRFYECLILARTEADAGPERRKQRTRIAHNLKDLGKWARSSPASYAARDALVRAEWARINDDDGAALRGYNQAIALAREHRGPNVEALACECALRFAHARGYPIVVRAYLVEAIGAYRSWGATARVARLVQEFRTHLPDEAPIHVGRTDTSPGTTTRSTSTFALDLDTVLKFGRTISGELHLGRLLTHMATLLVENAGARRGVLLLPQDGELRVEADATFDAARVNLGAPLDQYADLPRTIVHHVARLREDVVLADAIIDPVYGGDPDIVLRRPRSLLCTPILHQGELSCVLYLENDLAANVFTHRRLALIKQLAAQVAISLTNARLYERLDVARIAAQAADRAKTRFLMNMSHELRTPLNAILGYTELIAENLSEGQTETLDNDLRAIHSAGIRLLRSVSSILELSKLETDTHHARLTTFEPGPLVRSIAAQFTGPVAEHNNTLTIDCPPDLAPITTDAHMLRYSLTTLLDNAVRFTTDGQILLRVARFERNGDDAWIEFTVSDTGLGIEAHVLPTLFGAFTQADDAPTRKFDGTGVSLAVAHRFCELLGGELLAISTPGQGATFTMRLPTHSEITQTA